MQLEKVMNNLVSIELFKTDSFTKDEIEKIIGSDKMKEIMFLDQHPVFNCYVIAHEGIAQSNTGRVFNYVRSIIRKIYEKLSNSTKVFWRHNNIGGGDVQEGREEIGEIVGKTLVEDGGILKTVAIVYLSPKHRAHQLDICSIEAVVYVDDADRNVIDIKSIDGLALSTSSIENPGFPNARLIQQLSYFIEPEPTEEINHMSLTKEQVLEWIKENSTTLKPSEVFSVEYILLDPVVDGNVKKLLQTKHEHAKRLESKLGEVAKEHESQMQLLQDQMKKYQQKIWTVRGEEIVSANLKDEDEKIKEYVKNKVKTKITPELLSSLDSEDDLEKTVKQVFDEEIEEINKLKTIFSPPTSTTPKPDDKPIPKTWAKPLVKVSKPAIENPKDEIDQMVNELLDV